MIIGEMTQKIVKWLIVLILVPYCLSSCDPEQINTGPNGEESLPTGTLRVIFKVSHQWLPLDKIIRTGLHVAENGNEIYKGNYLYSTNVNNYQDQYEFVLSPGTYYYEASIACICGGDTCSAAGFPGSQYAEKHIMGRFDILKDSVTTVRPTFQ